MFEILLARKAQKFYNQAGSQLISELNKCFDNLSQSPFSDKKEEPLLSEQLIMDNQAHEATIFHKVEESFSYLVQQIHSYLKEQ